MANIEMQSKGHMTLRNKKGYTLDDLENFITEAKVNGADGDETLEVKTLRYWHEYGYSEYPAFEVELPSSLDYYRPSNTISPWLAARTLAASVVNRYTVVMVLMFISFATGVKFF